MKIRHVCAALGALAMPAVASAGTVDTSFTTDGTVARCDDCYTSAISPGFSLNFFGNTYSSFYVSNNGYITFQYGTGGYTPYGLGSGYSGQPIIAPFFADVDTRPSNGGTVTYGSGTYAGQNAYAVTWNSVGYYPEQTDKLNTFQLVLTDRSDVGTGDFDIYFNYDQTQWETGSASGGSGGFGGTPAAAGFNAGTGNASGTYYQIPGSLTTGSFEDNGTNPLIGQTNDNVPGQYLFQVRAGQVIVPPPTGGVPEPATWAMMILGFGAVGGIMRRRRTTTLRFA
ncbi:PEPxxWA-CTERM sorting domain-containing protein [Sphingomonas sp. CL5.1]|uniref:nidogen-like domain-containing protein n=1 Tax=Sphingomonas sp. CL5.1 TaxID=2653203 RepID=UPI0015827A7C|nr:nidogen-like domain-containing protein [Sphingomonas sp. CL5.1]QKR99068.1 PEPxxWA-CTERM sorting domain-containing protein [Sphingomonas sp. CL5.1]